MPPGRKIHAFVHTTIALVQDEKKLETKVSAAYSDLQGNPYSEEFIIALSMGRNEIMQPKSVSYLLDEMGKTLKETNKKLEAIKKTLSPKDISGFP